MKKTNRTDNARRDAPKSGEKKRKKRIGEIFDLDYLLGILLGAVSSVFLLGAVYYVCWHASDGFSE